MSLSYQSSFQIKFIVRTDLKKKLIQIEGSRI